MNRSICKLAALAVLTACFGCDRLGAADCTIVGPPGLDVSISITVGMEEVEGLEASLSLEGGLVFALPDVASSVTVEAAGYWARPYRVEASTEDCHFALVETGLVVGRFPPAAQGIGALQVRFEPSMDEGEPVEKRCPISDRTLQCELPVGSYDLRLAVDGFAPIYRWSQTISIDEPADLGLLKLETGASISGFVVRRTRNEDQPVEVELKPVVYGWHGDPKERRRFERRALRAQADARGFFQFSGVAPGRYSLEADGGPTGRAVVDDLEIEKDRESALEPLELQPLASAELDISPSLDPWGQPWRLILRQPIARANVLEVVAEARTDAGSAAFDSLENGDYEVLVEDSQGSSWHLESLEVFHGMEARFLTIDVVPVEGTVSVGDEPLVTRVIFGGQTRPRLVFVTDEDGRFEGSLPREGSWLVDLETPDLAWNRSLDPIDIRRRPGRSTAEVDIVLPGTKLSGRVFYDGEYAARSGVLVRSATSEPDHIASLVTTDEGAFELVGIEPATVRLMAYREGRWSEWRTLTVAEDAEAEVDLHLLDKKVLEGRVVAATGAPLAGAHVVGREAGNAFMPWRATTRSRVDGSFRLEFPDRASAVDLLISAPGQPVTLRRLQLTTNAEPVEIHLPADAGELLLIPSDPTLSYSLAYGSVRSGLDEWTETGYTLGWSSLDASGALRLSGLAAGEYRFCAVETGQCVQGRVDASEPVWLVTPPWSDPPPSGFEDESDS